MKHDAETDRDLWEAQANHLYEANKRLKEQVEEYEDEIRAYKMAHLDYRNKISALETQLTESRNNDRIAMSWINDFLEAANFNGTYPEFIEWIEARHRGE